MNHLEDKYKDWFSDQQFPNEGFDTEGLWDDISKDLDNRQPKNTIKIVGLLLLLAFITAGIIGSYFWWGDHQNSANNIKIEETTQRPNEIEKDFSQNQNNGQETQFQLIEKNAKSSKTTNSPNVNKIEKSVSNKNIISKSSEQQPIKSKVLLKNNVEKLEESKIFQIENSKPKITSEPKSELKKEKNKSDLDWNKTQKILVQTIPALSILLDSDYSIEPLRLTSKADLNQFEGEKKTTGKNNLNWKIGIQGGVNKLNLNYNSQAAADLANLKESTESGEWGASFGANATLVWKDRWLLGTGLEYHQAIVKFEYIDQKDFVVSKENQLLQIWLDASNNDTINTLYGNTTVDATSTRHVIHYNRYSKLTIPIEIGTQWQYGKWHYGSMGGVNLNLSLLQTGKILDANSEIVAFDQSSPEAPFKKLDIGFRVSPFVGYQLTKKIIGTVRPQLAWQFNRNIQGTDIKMNVQQFNLNVGVEYYFQ